MPALIKVIPCEKFIIAQQPQENMNSWGHMKFPHGRRMHRNYPTIIHNTIDGFNGVHSRQMKKPYMLILTVR
jgi:hypothetical protein